VRSAIFFIGRWVTNIGLVAVAVAAGVKPEDAMSNLSGWATWFHLPAPYWLQSHNADRVALSLAIFGIAVRWVGPPIWRRLRGTKGQVSPLEITFDAANPLNRFWSLEPLRDEKGSPQGAFWQYRALLKNRSAQTLRNVRVTVEGIGAMPTRPEPSIFDLNKQAVIDLPPGGETLVTIRTWSQPHIRAGYAIGPGIYGPIKMTAHADDTTPAIKYFEFDYMNTPMIWEISAPA
jgi:hypothetical protein